MGSEPHLHKLLAAPDGALAQLLADGRRQQQLLAQVRQRLPGELADAVASAGIADGALHLGVTSGAWASRLRFLAPQLRRQLGDRLGQPLNEVCVHVLACVTPPPAAAAPTVQPLSSASRAHLQAVADATADPRLAGALRALADAGPSRD
jgi:hypothetical protein